MRKPAKTAAKRRAGHSSALPEIPPVSPLISQRFSQRDEDEPPPTPIPLAIAPALIRGGTLDQAQHRQQILRRADYLGQLARAYFAANPADVWRRADDPDRHEAADHGAIGALIANVQDCAKRGRWRAAQSAYEHAERIALSRSQQRRAARAEVSTAVLRAQAEQTAKLESEQRAGLVRTGNAAKRRQAERRAKPLVEMGKRLRRDHPEWSLNSIITEIRRKPPAAARRDLSPRQLRRHLVANGVK